jgi:hypothetical protein
MTNLLSFCSQLLSDFGFDVEQAHVGAPEYLVFEDQTVLGFVFAYDDPRSLIDSWLKDSDAVISAQQLGLRRAGQKAWNTYLILVAQERADGPASAALTAIEENLVGTRKIARAGIQDLSAIRTSLLSLLPLQSAPQLEAVDMPSEIRLRTTALPTRAVDAFLSAVDENVVLQVLEHPE